MFPRAIICLSILAGLALLEVSATCLGSCGLTQKCICFDSIIKPARLKRPLALPKIVCYKTLGAKKPCPIGDLCSHKTQAVLPAFVPKPCANTCQKECPAVPKPQKEEIKCTHQTLQYETEHCPCSCGYKRVPVDPVSMDLHYQNQRNQDNLYQDRKLQYGFHKVPITEHHQMQTVAIPEEKLYQYKSHVIRLNPTQNHDSCIRRDCEISDPKLRVNYRDLGYGPDYGNGDRYVVQNCQSVPHRQVTHAPCRKPAGHCDCCNRPIADCRQSVPHRQVTHDVAPCRKPAGHCDCCNRPIADCRQSVPHRQVTHEVAPCRKPAGHCDCSHRPIADCRQSVPHRQVTHDVAPCRKPAGHCDCCNRPTADCRQNDHAKSEIKYANEDEAKPHYFGLKELLDYKKELLGNLGCDCLKHLS